MGRELPDRGTEAHRGQLLRPPRHSLHLTELPVTGHRGNRATEYLSVEKSVSTPLRTARRWRKHQLAVLLANRVIGHAPPPAVGRRYGSVCEQRSNVFRRGKLVLGQLGPTWERIKDGRGKIPVIYAHAIMKDTGYAYAMEKFSATCVPCT
jgi:hypothetical protein